MPDADRFLGWINSLLLPLKLIVPQPIIERISFLTTNKDIRISAVLDLVVGSLLDIGCGDNRLVLRYRQYGGEGVGVDVYDWGAQDLLVEDTSHLPFADGTFDTVTMIACINHIPNRSDVLKEAYRLLHREGCLVITNLTPVISMLWHKFAFWDRDQHERGMKPGEVYGFYPEELQDLVESAGFALERSKKISWGLNAVYAFKKRHRQPVRSM